MRAVFVERPYALCWSAANHKELMASVEIDPETCCTTITYPFPFLPEVSAADWGLGLTKD